MRHNLEVQHNLLELQYNLEVHQNLKQEYNF